MAKKNTPRVEVITEPTITPDDDMTAAPPPQGGVIVDDSAALTDEQDRAIDKAYEKTHNDGVSEEWACYRCRNFNDGTCPIMLMALAAHEELFGTDSLADVIIPDTCGGYMPYVVVLEEAE